MDRELGETGSWILPLDKTLYLFRMFIKSDQIRRRYQSNGS